MVSEDMSTLGPASAVWGSLWGLVFWAASMPEGTGITETKGNDAGFDATHAASLGAHAGRPLSGGSGTRLFGGPRAPRPGELEPRVRCVVLRIWASRVVGIYDEWATAWPPRLWCLALG